MSFSYYEIYITCQRALSSIGFPYGADEDAAHIISWLELNKLNGIKKFSKFLTKKNIKYNGKFKLNEIYSKDNINLKKTSLLMKGPGLFDYLSQKIEKKDKITIILKQCIDPIFLIPLIYKLGKKKVFINSFWLENNTVIEIKTSNNNMIIKKIINKFNINKNELVLNISKKKINSKIKTKKIHYQINEKNIQKRLSVSIKPNKKDWELVSFFANKTFVPESKESRSKGAGGGDDND